MTLYAVMTMQSNQANKNTFNTSGSRIFEALPTSTEAGWQILEMSANYYNSMRILNEYGLRPLTFKEALSRLNEDEELKDSLKEACFYLGETRLEENGFYTIDKKGNLVEGKGKSEEETVDSWSGRYQLSLDVASDPETVRFGRRYDLHADRSPFHIVPMIVGVPRDMSWILRR